MKIIEIGASDQDSTSPHSPYSPVVMNRKSDGERRFKPVAVLISHQTPPGGRPATPTHNQRIEIHV